MELRLKAKLYGRRRKKKKENHFAVLRPLLCRVSSGCRTFTAQQLSNTRVVKEENPGRVPAARKDQEKNSGERLSHGCKEGLDLDQVLGQVLDLVLKVYLNLDVDLDPDLSLNLELKFPFGFDSGSLKGSGT